MKYCKYFYKLSFYIQHVYDSIYLYVNFCKMFIHSALTSNNHFLYDGGGIYKSPFKIQSRKRSTKLILTQSVDQTKLNKPHTHTSTIVFQTSQNNRNYVSLSQYNNMEEQQLWGCCANWPHHHIRVMYYAIIWRQFLNFD